jgi:acyl carrier protein
LTALPLTVNGKLDVNALPPPAVGLSGLGNRGSQSLSETEERVSQIFSETLGLQGIGPDDNFFDCGGTSLLLIKAHLLVQTEFERQIPITVMFECPTVRSLAARLSAEKPTTSAINAVQQQARRSRDAFARARAAKGGAS